MPQFRRAVALAFLTAGVLAGPALADDSKKDGGARPKDAPSKETPEKTSSDKTPPRPQDPQSAPGASAPGAPSRASDAGTAKGEVAKSVAPARAAPKSLEQALAVLEMRRVNVDFRDAELSRAAEFAGQVSGINVILAPALSRNGTDAVPKLTLKLSDVTLRQAVEFAAKLTGTRLVLRDGILQFTTPQDAKGEPVLRIHPLGDLAVKLRNFPGPDIQIRLASAEFEDEKESEVDGGLDDPEEIIEMIRKMTGDGTWDSEDVSISGDARRLVVKQYPDVHREIAKILALLRAAK